MAEKKREGGQPKDKVITEGFNPQKRGNLSKALLRKAKLEKARQDAERNKQERELQELEAQVKAARNAFGRSPKEAPESPPDSNEQSDIDHDDAKSAYQMLQDMRWVYKNVKGRQRLKELCADDKQFLFMVKELMKIEAGLMNAKIRAKEEGNGGGQQTVFVVMRGLLDDPVKKLEEKGRVDGSGDVVDVDFRQIEHALNPESGPYEEPKEIEKELSRPELDW